MRLRTTKTIGLGRFKTGELLAQFQSTKRLFTILIDPDKTELSSIETLVRRLPYQTTHLFVGGSIVAHGKTGRLVSTLKKHTTVPIILFPGDASQITNDADGILFLSLLSGRNPEFLIEQHIKAIPKLKNASLEIIPTAYILIDGGNETEVQRVSQTIPMSQSNIKGIVNTALAAQYSGKQLIYLEAGSGAEIPVNSKIIKAVSAEVKIPIIVGGGIRDAKTIDLAYESGATMVVVGNAFEEGFDDF